MLNIASETSVSEANDFPVNLSVHKSSDVEKL